MQWAWRCGNRTYLGIRLLMMSRRSLLAGAAANAPPPGICRYSGRQWSAPGFALIMDDLLVRLCLLRSGPGVGCGAADSTRVRDRIGVGERMAQIPVII
jgi:hypothetical protein